MANETSKDQEKKEIQMIPIEKIYDLPDMPIFKYTDKSLGGLVSSIQSSGVTEPVILRQTEDGNYQLISGYRRRRAAELAKLKELPALVYDITEQTAREYYSTLKSNPDAQIIAGLVPMPGKDEKPKVKDEKASEQPAKEDTKPESKPPVAEPPKAPPAKPTEEKKQEQAPAPDTKADEKPKADKTEAEKKPDAAKEEKTPDKGEKAAAPTGPTAAGPSGTAITQVFEPRLDPPDEKALKDLPKPKKGESYFITLHPGYLEKSVFNNFSVDIASENFRELKRSIYLAGVKDPVLARPKEGGGLEILSGQRRHMIAKELNYPVPTIVQLIDDDDAKIIVADSNLHRDKITSYDLSRALRMKMEGMKRKAGRRKKSDLDVPLLNTDEQLAKEMGMSVSKLNKMVRLSEAIERVCDRYDDGDIELSIAYALSFLKPETQEAVLNLSDAGYKLTTKRIERMKPLEQKGKLTPTAMRDILEDKDLTPPQQAAPNAPTVSAAPMPATPSNAGSPASPEKTVAEPTSSTPATPSETPHFTVFGKGNGTANVETKADDDILKGKQERPEVTKVILAGDRLRRYFPDVSMTPREIEESVYEALEEREQRRKREKLKGQKKTDLLK